MRVASAARAPPADSATRVPITPTPTRVPTTQNSAATVTVTWRRRSAGTVPGRVSVVIRPLHHAPGVPPGPPARAAARRCDQASHRFGDYSWPVRRLPCADLPRPDLP